MDPDSVLDPENDERVRTALRNADAMGSLGVVSLVTAYPEEALREIMNGTEPLSFMDRASLLVHIDNQPEEPDV